MTQKRTYTAMAQGEGANDFKEAASKRPKLSENESAQPLFSVNKVPSTENLSAAQRVEIIRP